MKYLIFCVLLLMSVPVIAQESTEPKTTDSTASPADDSVQSPQPSDIDEATPTDENLSEDWLRALPRTAILSYLKGKEPKIHVVDVHASAAGKVFRHHVSSAAEVLEPPLDPVPPNASDVEIVNKIGPDPGSQVFVLRFVDAGGNPLLIVTIYDSDAQPIGGFSASPTQPAPQAGGGVTENEILVAHGDRNTREKEAEGEISPAFRSYSLAERHAYLERNSFSIRQASNGSTEWLVRQGREELSQEDFFRKISRRDLAEELSANETKRDVVRWGGFGVAMLGCALFIADYQSNPDDFEDPVSGLGYLGYGLMGVGGIAAAISYFMETSPVSVSEARRLANNHNAKVADMLGLRHSQLHSKPQSPKSEIGFGIGPTKRRWNGVGVRKVLIPAPPLRDSKACHL